MTQDDITFELRAAPGGELTVWAVLYEDIYETGLGDGYYAYLADAFFTRDAAERFAEDSAAYRFHLRQVRLALKDGRFVAEPIDLKHFESVDTESLIAALSHDPTPRKPKSQY